MTRANEQPASDAAAPGERVYHQEISVPFEYPVHFTHDLFDPADELFASVLDRLNERRRHRAAVYVDSGAVEAHPDLLRRIGEYFHAHADRLELAGPLRGLCRLPCIDRLALSLFLPGIHCVAHKTAEPL